MAREVYKSVAGVIDEVLSSASGSIGVKQHHFADI
jgi:hypothetical protein